MPLIDHPRGNYRFLPGIAPYSCGVVAAPGFEIVHVTLHRSVGYRSGFDLIEAHLADAKRSKDALCAIELRSPTPFTFAGFAAFNAEYAKILESWGLFVNGVNPVARTNVAPALLPPAEPSLHAFSYTRPCASGTPLTFVVAGAGELPEGVLEAPGIVRSGDISADGIAAKAEFVMDLMESRLKGLGGDWPLVTTLDVYTIHEVARLLPTTILGRVGLAASKGIQWFYTRPPIIDIEFEMDLRGVKTEVLISN